MKYDGQHMQLMVHGEDARVESVDVGRAQSDSLLIKITLVAYIAPEVADDIATAWNGSVDGGAEIRAAMNGGRAAGAREAVLKTKLNQLRRKMEKLERRLAKRTLVEVPDLPVLD